MSVLSNIDKENDHIPKSVNKSKKGDDISNTDITKAFKLHLKSLSDKKKKKNLKFANNTPLRKIDEHEMNRVVNQFLNHYKTSYDLCINSLIQFPSYRNKEVIDLIKPYLKELIGLMDIVSKEKNEEFVDKTISQIAMNLQYKKIEKDKFICKYGEKGNHFYIILKGKVVFLVPKLVKCYLNECEYIYYLLKLKRCGENELLRNMVNINRQYYDLGDDFDYYIREVVDDYKKAEKSISLFLTPELYNTLKRIIEAENENKMKEKKVKDNTKETENEKEKENGNEENESNEKIEINKYIERSLVDDMDLGSKDRKKVNVYQYEITNYYEEGQIFGMVALESKYGKRSATAISLENCELGLLTKEQYNSCLEAIHIKSVEILFNLINSYNILGLAPKKAFENRFCHMFKCIRLKRGAQIMEENKKINSVIVFNSGQFTITLNKNILELNELIIKLQKVRGKMMGLSENVIKKELSENVFSKEFFMKQKFILPETMKMYQKKHNFTLSIINDKLVVGLLDTVDPETHLPLFNCTCISAVCDGYEITNNSLDLVNKEYSCNNNSNQISLINVEYFLKRLQLHMKEIESKIDNYNKNLKYDIKPKNEVKAKNINNKNVEEGKMIIIENNKNENNNAFEIRRNTFYIKSKNNNEISLVQMLGKSLKNDYATIKKQRYNTIDKYNDSSTNLNAENKLYDNINAINDETVETNKEKNLSYSSKVKKSIQRKEHLLKLAQDKSNKYMAKKKAEMRSLNIARKARNKKDQYIDLSKIFNKSNSSSDDKKDIVLDSIINNINKNSKYNRILSSFVHSDSNRNRNRKIIKDTGEEKIDEMENSYMNNNIIEDNNDMKNNGAQSHSYIKKISIKSPINEEKIENYPKNDKSVNVNIEENEIEYPAIKPNLKNLIYDNYKKSDSRNVIENRSNNIITIDGQNSIGNQDLSNIRSSRRLPKNYNKVLNNNYRISRKLLQLSKQNHDSAGADNLEINNGKLPSILSLYNKDKVHVVDPLVYDRFNNQYFNKRLKTLDV